ncbi:MAG: Uma2 family endonuclease [Acidimicrobiales bacterium]|nr:Uma2 family endonuclease [Acidimicrobiales bacterium]
MTLTQHEGFTIADLEDMPEDGRRYELIGGSIVVNASPRPRHQLASKRLCELLGAACPPDHEVFYAPLDLDLPDEQRVEPDLLVVPHASIGEERISLPVLLLVELVSPSTAVWDTVAKREVYEVAGVPHYWMLDTREGQERFTALRLRDGAYEVAFQSTDRIEFDDPLSVSTPLADLFAVRR